MRKVILSLAAITLTTVAAPGLAQHHPNNSQSYNSSYATDSMAVRIGQLQTRLQEGVRNGAITRRKARPIRQDIQRLSHLERQYGVNGLTGQERATLQQRIRTVRQQLRRADDGAQGRYAQWDRKDDSAWGASIHGRVDANRDGWDDRDYNRNGRWEDDVNYGYQQPAPRTGIAGVIDSVIRHTPGRFDCSAFSAVLQVPIWFIALARFGNLEDSPCTPARQHHAADQLADPRLRTHV